MVSQSSGAAKPDQGSAALAVTMDHVLRSMEAIAGDVREVREDVVAIKNSGFGRSLDEIRERVTKNEAEVVALQQADARREGERQAAGWMAKNLPPFLWAMAAATLAIAGSTVIGG